MVQSFPWYGDELLTLSGGFNAVLKAYFVIYIDIVVI